MNNTFVGIDAGRNNILGDNNTVIGAGADVRGSGLHFATAIGAGASVSEDDTIEIGRSADKVLIRGNVLTNLGFYFAGLSDAGDVHACVANSNLPSPPIYKYVGICVSSIKYKTNVLPLNSGLDLIRKLQPVTYNWKASGTAAIGLIAEEVFAVDPILTVPDEMGEPGSVKYDSVTVVLVNAVKEQQSQIEAQSARLKALETQNRAQRDMIQAQQKQIDELVKLICTKVADGGSCNKAIPPK